MSSGEESAGHGKRCPVAVGVGGAVFTLYVKDTDPQQLFQVEDTASRSVNTFSS